MASPPSAGYFPEMKPGPGDWNASMSSESTATGMISSRWSLALRSSSSKVTEARRMSPPDRSLVVVFRMEWAAVGVHFTT